LKFDWDWDWIDDGGDNNHWICSSCSLRCAALHCTALHCTLENENETIQTSQPAIQTIHPSIMEQDTTSSLYHYHYYNNNNHHHHQYYDSFQRLSPSRTIVSSFTPYQPTANATANTRPEESFSLFSYTNTCLDQGDWALCLAQPSKSEYNSNNTSSSTFACALSNGQVHVYDTERLHRVHTMAHHSSNYRNCPSTLITHLCYKSNNNNSSSSNNNNDQTDPPSNNLITTCAHDGSLCLFDIRSSCSSGAPVLRGSLPAGQSAFHLDWGYGGTVVAVASTKGRIHFFDWRVMSTSSSSSSSSSSSTDTGGMTLLGTYRESHVDDVTQVLFASDDGKHLLTGSEDGLLGCYDTTQPTEALAVQSVCRVGAPIRKLGRCSGGAASSSSSSSSLVYCLTGSETMSLWNIETATCVYDFGMQLRDDLTHRLAVAGAAVNTTTAPSSGPQSEPLQQMEYLVDATWDAPSQQLFLTAGNAVGDAAIFRLASTTIPANQQHQQHIGFTWQPCHYLTGGHRGVVRAAMHLHTSSPAGHQILVTAGEDARLCEWKTNLGMTRPTVSSSSVSSSSCSSNHHHAMVTDHMETTNGPRSFSPSSSFSWTSPAAPLTTVGGTVGGGPIRRPRRQPFRPFAAPY